MNGVVKKVEVLRSLPYRVIVFCPRCTSSKLINLHDYPGYTLDDIHLKMQCSSCGAVGLDFSIVQSDEEAPD